MNDRPTCPICGHHMINEETGICINCLLNAQEGIVAPKVTIDDEGFIGKRTLPDGRYLALQPQTFGKSLLGISHPLIPLIFSDVWEYMTVERGQKALAEWNPEETSEPTGWTRRRRQSQRDGPVIPPLGGGVLMAIRHRSISENSPHAGNMNLTSYS